MKKSFKALYCERNVCAQDEYDWQVFHKCLNPHAAPLARLLRRVNPSFFREDFEFIREVGAATSRAEVIGELNRFYGRNMRDRNWLRRSLGIRLSGKRVLRLYRELLRLSRPGRR